MPSDRTEAVGETSGRDRERRTIPAADDQGKTVVDRQDQEIGLVSGVEGDTLHVDPDPTLTSRLKAALGWDDMDADDLPVPPELIERIDDRVVLNIDRDEEYQERTS